MQRENLCENRKVTVHAKVNKNMAYKSTSFYGREHLITTNSFGEEQE